MFSEFGLLFESVANDAYTDSFPLSMEEFELLCSHLSDPLLYQSYQTRRRNTSNSLYTTLSKLGIKRRHDLDMIKIYAYIDEYIIPKPRPAKWEEIYQ